MGANSAQVVCWHLSACASEQPYPRRLQHWMRDRTLERELESLTRDFKKRDTLDLSECRINDTFVVARTWDSVWERPSGAKVGSSWRWQTRVVVIVN